MHIYFKVQTELLVLLYLSWPESMWLVHNSQRTEMFLAQMLFVGYKRKQKKKLRKLRLPWGKIM